VIAVADFPYKVCPDCEGVEPPCCECGRDTHCCHYDDAFWKPIWPYGSNPPDTVVEDISDADISSPPDWVTWYPVNDPRASWNLPK
jgi:hypothetical protein